MNRIQVDYTADEIDQMIEMIRMIRAPLEKRLAEEEAEKEALKQRFKSHELFWQGISNE